MCNQLLQAQYSNLSSQSMLDDHQCRVSQDFCHCDRLQLNAVSHHNKPGGIYLLQAVSSKWCALRQLYPAIRKITTDEICSSISGNMFFRTQNIQVPYTVKIHSRVVYRNRINLSTIKSAKIYHQSNGPTRVYTLVVCTNQYTTQKQKTSSVLHYLDNAFITESPPIITNPYFFSFLYTLQSYSTDLAK